MCPLFRDRGTIPGPSLSTFSEMDVQAEPQKNPQLRNNRRQESATMHFISFETCIVWCILFVSPLKALGKSPILFMANPSEKNQKKTKHPLLVLGWCLRRTHETPRSVHTVVGLAVLVAPLLRSHRLLWSGAKETPHRTGTRRSKKARAHGDKGS